jgi:hypothetical protein
MTEQYLPHRGGNQQVQMHGQRRIEQPRQLLHEMPREMRPGVDYPRYLIRNSDSMVLPYNEILAQDGANFTPSNDLPKSHTDNIAAARQREEEIRQAIMQAEAKQAAQQQLQQQEYEKLIQKYKAEQISAPPTVTKEEQLRLDEAVIVQRDAAGLQKYATEEFGVAIGGNLIALREQVRILQNHRRDKMSEPKPAEETAPAQ